MRRKSWFIFSWDVVVRSESYHNDLVINLDDDIQNFFIRKADGATLEYNLLDNKE